MKKKIPITGLCVLVLAACLAAAVCFLINPREEIMESEGRSAPESSEYVDEASDQSEKDFSDGMNGEKVDLTLEDVVRLSEKGWELDWADFDGYSFLPTGSGLYINTYPIDQNFSLIVGGIGEDYDPMYIYLHSKAAEDWIEVREGGVEAFIEKWEETED